MMFAAHGAMAACMNKYIAQRDGSKYTLTILTGKISYAEAYELAQTASKSPALLPEWVDEKGKMITRALDMKVIRPMPVACDDKPMGVVISTTFLVARPLNGKIYLKFDDKNTVALEQQER